MQLIKHNEPSERKKSSVNSDFGETHAATAEYCKDGKNWEVRGAKVLQMVQFEGPSSLQAPCTETPLSHPVL